MHESWAEKIIHAIVFLAICATIVFVGWNEPLSYRFMSPEAITELEEPPVPEAPRRLSAMEWSSQHNGTALDRAPYRRLRNGKIRYSSNIDEQKVGSPTETDPRTGLRRIKGGVSTPAPESPDTVVRQ